MSKLTTQTAIDLVSLMEDFDTDSECRAYLEELRWPKGIECPRCQGKTISRIKARKVFECDGCSYQFSVMAGTLFHDSHLPLTKWFLAIFLITESRKGMSALQLKRLLKVSYKTAWYLCHRIREAMIDQTPEKLTGTVEVDETYIGGTWRGRPKSDDGREERLSVPRHIDAPHIAQRTALREAHGIASPARATTNSETTKRALFTASTADKKSASVSGPDTGICLMIMIPATGFPRVV